jgi:hypothetical protein
MTRSNFVPLAAIRPSATDGNAHPVAVYLARLAPNTRVLATAEGGERENGNQD